MLLFNLPFSTPGIPDDVKIIDVILMGNVSPPSFFIIISLQTLSPNAGLDVQYIGRLNMTDGLIILLRNGVCIPFISAR